MVKSEKIDDKKPERSSPGGAGGDPLWSAAARCRRQTLPDKGYEKDRAREEKTWG